MTSRTHVHSKKYPHTPTQLEKRITNGNKGCAHTHTARTKDTNWREKKGKCQKCLRCLPLVSPLACTRPSTLPILAICGIKNCYTLVHKKQKKMGEKSYFSGRQLGKKRTAFIICNNIGIKCCRRGKRRNATQGDGNNTKN